MAVCRSAACVRCACAKMGWRRSRRAVETCRACHASTWRTKPSLVLPAPLCLCLPSVSTPESQEMLRPGGVRSVLGGIEVKPGRFIYFVGVPRITQKSGPGCYSGVSMFIMKIQSTVGQSSRCSKEALGIIQQLLANIYGKHIQTWKIPSPPPANMEGGCTHSMLLGEIFVVSFMTGLLSF